jgi:hypothetical protein
VRRCVCVYGLVDGRCIDKTPYLRRLNWAVVDNVLSTSAKLGPSYIRSYLRQLH